MKVYNYLNLEHLQQIAKEIRDNPYNRNKNYIFLDENTVIEDYNPYLLVNGLIANTLDSFDIFDRRKDFIFYETYAKGKPTDYMEKILKVLLEMKIDGEEYLIPHILSAVKGCFHLPTVVADRIIFLDHSLDDYLDAYDESEDFRNMIDKPAITCRMNPYEAYNASREIPNLFRSQILIKPLTELKLAGVKVNDKQIMQNITWGFVPDVIDPSVMGPYFIEEGCLTQYKTFESYYIDGRIGRKAVLTAKSEVQQVGAASKRTGTVLLNVRMNAPKTREYMHDCGSTRHLLVHIKDKNDLKFNRYSYFKNGMGGYDYIDIDRIDLIGKTLEIRTMMYCNHPDHVCEMCYGHMHQFARDTKITKFNFSIATLVELAKKLQGVISIKHAISGILLDIFVSYKGNKEHINDFVKNNSFIKSFEYNKLYLDTKNHDITFTKERNYYDMYIDNIEVKLENSKITDKQVLDNGDTVITILLPNKSVLTEADDMLNALNKHHKSPEFTKGWDKDLTVDQKIEYIFNYLNKYMKFYHRRFTETLTVALVRDIDNPSKKVTDKSRDIEFIRVSDVIKKPSYSDNLSSTIPYGWFEKQIKFIKNPSEDGETAPNDYDLLYMSKDVTSDDSPYIKMGRKLNELVEQTSHSNNEEIYL